MKLKRTESGLVIPAAPEETKPEEPPRWPLELGEHEDRSELGRCFAAILNMPACSSGIFAPEKPIGEARAKLVRAVAHQLLGADWDCELFC